MVKAKFTDNGCLDIYNEETPVDWFDTEGEKTKEDISVFSCKERKSGEKFIPYISDSGITKKELLLQAALFYYIKIIKVKTILKKVYTTVGICITAFRR